MISLLLTIKYTHCIKNVKFSCIRSNKCKYVDILKLINLIHKISYNNNNTLTLLHIKQNIFNNQVQII